MALQIYTRDVVPELIQAQTAQTAETLAGVGNNSFRAFEKMGDENKRTNQQAKAVESFFGAMTDEERASAGVPDKIAFKNLSAKDKIGWGTGMQMRQQFQQGQQQIQQGQRQMEVDGARLRDYAALARSREARGQVPGAMLRRLSEQETAGQDPLAALSGRGPLNEMNFDASVTSGARRPALSPGSLAMLQGHAEAGAPLDDSVLAALLREIGDGGAAAGWNLKPGVPIDFPDGTRSYPTSKGSVQLKQDQPGNPDGATERTLSDGTLLSWNGRQWVAAARPKGVGQDFTKSLGELAMGIDDPKQGPAVRRGIKAMIDSAHTLKQLDTAQRDGLYAQFGLSGDGAGNGAAPAGVNMETELQQAQNAISQGRSRESVARKFKERTGKDLPQ